MATPFDQQLSRRERQIMEIVYTLGKASVADVLEAMDEPPSYSAVRTIMNLMVEKGFLKYKGEGKKYVYYPAVAREKASRSALNNVLETFFSGSVAQAVVSLINQNKDKMSAEDLDRLSRLIDEAKRKEEGGRR
ncbi:MAG: BlaI/MecI/CopY family transcriptional regulator [Candidatus Sumerlaeia bacterium]